MLRTDAEMPGVQAVSDWRPKGTILIRIGLAAEMIGVTKSTLRRWDRTERLRAWRIGQARYFNHSELLAVAKERGLQYRGPLP